MWCWIKSSFVDLGGWKNRVVLVWLEWVFKGRLPMIMAKSSQVMNKSINPSIVKVTLPRRIIPGSVDKMRMLMVF
ncbi:hypothetical protein [uncultured Gammaproteobacteria bacterium]|nr:hypothetical protein [uncultured Gammaproteobacteria bacterium]